MLDAEQECFYWALYLGLPARYRRGTLPKLILSRRCDVSK